MPDPRSLCVRCGADKELPLGRCAACGHLPTRGEAALSVLVSSRMLAPAELDAVQARLRRGEPLRPSQERLEAAAALLAGNERQPRQLSAREAAGLAGLGVLLTPIVPLVYAWTWRGHPAARTAIGIAVGAAVVDGAAWAGVFSAAR